MTKENKLYDGRENLPLTGLISSTTYGPYVTTIDCLIAKLDINFACN